MGFGHAEWRKDMNKIEFQQHMDEILQMISNGRYSDAVELCDELNLDQLKKPKDLQKIAKAYEKCRRYADAEDILLQAREAAPRSRSTLFHLCTVAVKADDLESARTYYDAFCKIAPDDKERYVLQYRIAMKEGAPVKQLIRILEASKEDEPDDKWMFELARLYAGTGDNDRCVETCDEIEMWFSSGRYVEAAAELKRRIESGDSFEGVLPETREHSVTEDETGELELPENAYMPQEQAEEQTPGAEKAAADPKADSEETQPEEAPVRPAEPVRRPVRTEAKPRKGLGALFNRNTEEKRTPPPSRYEQPTAPGGRNAGTGTDTKRPSPEKRREMELTGDSWIPAWTGRIPDIEGDPDLSDAGISPYSAPTPAAPAGRRSGKDDSWAFTMDVGSATPERTGRIKPVTDADEAGYRAYHERDAYKTQEEDSRYAKSGSYEAPRETEAAGKPKKKDYDDYTAALGYVPDSVYDRDLKEPEETVAAEAPQQEPDPVTQAIEAPDEHVTIKVKGPSVQKAVEYESVSFDTLRIPAASSDAAEQVAEAKKEADASASELLSEKIPETGVAETDKAETAEAAAAAVPETAEPARAARTEDGTPAGQNTASAPEKDTTEKQEKVLTRPSQEPLPEDYGLSAEELEARVAAQDLKARKQADIQQFRNLPIEPELDKTIWHFLVIGDNPALTLESARERMKELGDLYPNGPKKMLKIEAEKIGDASIVNSLDRFLGNMVIVQHASVLQDRQLKEFAKILDKDDRSLLVAFTDRRNAAADLLRRAPELFDSFTAVFEGRTYTPRDLVDVARDYLLKEDAKLSRDAQAVVFEEARRLLTEHTGYYRNKIRTFVRSALDRADSGGFLGLGGGRFDKDGYLIITAKHFK